MANGKIKTFTTKATASSNVYMTVTRFDGLMINNADGFFASAPSEFGIPVPEISAGVYTKTENRCIWPNGVYSVSFYIRAGSTPVLADDTLLHTDTAWVVNDVVISTNTENPSLTTASASQVVEVNSGADGLTFSNAGGVLTSAHIYVGNASNVATDVEMTGDVTISNAGVTAIGANKVTLAMQAQVATASLLGRATAGTGNQEVLSVSSARTLLGIGTADTPTFTSVLLSGLTASLPVFSDGTKTLVSNTMTGTGSVVMSASPTLTGTALAANFTTSGQLISNYSASDNSNQFTINMSANQPYGSGLKVISNGTDFSMGLVHITKGSGTINSANGSYLLIDDGTNNLFRVRTSGAIESNSITCSTDTNAVATLATFLNPNTGTLNYSKLLVGQSTSNYMSMQYAGTGFTTAGNLMANQGLLYLPSTAVNGFLLRCDADAPLIFSPNNTEYLRVSSAAVKVSTVALQLSAANTVSASVATASTHKALINIGGTDYYALLTNVP